MDLEGKYFIHTKITLKSINSFYNNVKVTIFDLSNKKIWKKTIKGAFLYVFPSGQVQVGQRNFNQIIIYREKKDSDDFFCIVNTEEGIY